MIANFRAWYNNSLRGKSYIYHTGFLARDRETRGKDPTEQAYFDEIKRIANYAYKLQEEGRVSLVQRKLEPMRYEYIATKVK